MSIRIRPVLGVVALAAVAVTGLLTTAAAPATGSAVAAHCADRVDRRDVYVPRILSPRAGEVWRSGERVEVTWDVSDPPRQITNRTGSVLLRVGERTLDCPVLAEDFDILRGHVEVTVPNVPPGDDYRIVLFGDSGNFSEPFTITSEP
ncbi:GPI anchored serine-threonine rich family protein [Streptomyces sp. FH025]|uniref:GPI anchored serine-threonine rich family protein n=1 Tax=Streptomyces sp. FH025 TaxID=2815937 RepID=UPI001A9E7451|nr:GPI anchored serine-threonine rich family protein [Streptomyces sp. FH025]MBO1419655.1 GPI anchored serine-threonine rich family protein [Streptomyces sp. FH025]